MWQGHTDTDADVDVDAYVAEDVAAETPPLCSGCR